MIIILKMYPTDDEVSEVEANVRELGYEPHTIRGEVRTVIAAVGDESQNASLESLVTLPMVENVLPVQKKYQLISKETHHEPTKFKVGPHEIGGGVFHVIAGPCSVESAEQMRVTGVAVKERGASMIRGGAFKPRTSPYDFQGLGQEGLDILRDVKELTGLPIVTELVKEQDIKSVVEVADIIQIGARTAQNYSLL